MGGLADGGGVGVLEVWRGAALMELDDEWRAGGFVGLRSAWVSVAERLAEALTSGGASSAEVDFSFSWLAPMGPT